jgi:hypothetical protein
MVGAGRVAEIVCPLPEDYREAPELIEGGRMAV